MPIKSIQFKSNSLTKWQWPLKVGLPTGNSHLRNKLLMTHWPKEFTIVERIPAQAKTPHYNIVITESDIKMENFGISNRYTADIIIILKKNAEIFATALGPKILPSIANQLKCNGIFIISLGRKTISQWFYEFTVHLSHNQNVVQAIHNSVSDGFFYYDRKLEKQTTLAHITNVLMKALSNRKDQRSTFTINTRLTNQKEFTAKEAADLLKSHSISPAYARESGDASDLNEISRPVFKEMGDELYKISPEKGLSPLKYKISKGSKFDDDILGNSKTSGRRREIDSRGGGAPRKKSARERKMYAPDSRMPKLSDGKKYQMAKQKAAASQKEAEASRYLQAKITTGKKKEAKTNLKPNTEYNIEVRIGTKDEKFIDAGHTFDANRVFKSSNQKKEPIRIKFKSNLEDRVQFTKIILPRIGNSTPANFNFKTNGSLTTFVGDIFAYHKNRLIQRVQLNAVIDKNYSAKTLKNTIQMNVIFCARKNLADIKDRIDFTSSVEYQSGTKKSSSISGITNNKPIDLYFADGLKVHLADMKKAIEDALVTAKKNPTGLVTKDNQELLLFLALKGNLIYSNHLLDAIAPEGPLQIITNYQEYAPLDFVYSLPPPAPNATLCQNAAIALQEGACKKCFDHSQDPAPHICPFGFWAFSRVIERHSYKRRKNERQSDYSLVSEPTSTRNTLNILANSIYGSSQRVETTQTKGIRKEIATAIKQNISAFYEADDWEKWTALVEEHKPDSLILVVHIEKDSSKIDRIEIGKSFISQNYFRSRVTNKNTTPPPFIIIIGCEATNLDTGGFDVSTQFMNNGAAIVLSNFTKIRGRQAKDVVIKLVEFLKQNGKSEILFGEVLLKLRQYLLSQGLMAGLSLVAQGDADWKIKS